VLDDADGVCRTVGGVEDVGLLGEVVNHCSLSCGLWADDKDLELREVVH
jgi:hypothetical protein